MLPGLQAGVPAQDRVQSAKNTVVKVLNQKKLTKIHQIWTVQFCCTHNSLMKHSKAAIDQIMSEQKIEKSRKLELYCKKSTKQWSAGSTKMDNWDKLFVRSSAGTTSGIRGFATRRTLSVNGSSLILTRFSNYSKLLLFMILYHFLNIVNKLICNDIRLI